MLNRLNDEMKLNAFLFSDIDQLTEQKDGAANLEKNKDMNEQENSDSEVRRKKYILHRAHVIVYKYEIQKDKLKKYQFFTLILLLATVFCIFASILFIKEINYRYIISWSALFIIGVLCSLSTWWLRKKTLRLETTIKGIYNMTVQYQCGTGMYQHLTESEKISLYAEELEELVL